MLSGTCHRILALWTSLSFLAMETATNTFTPKDLYAREKRRITAALFEARRLRCPSLEPLYLPRNTHHPSPHRHMLPRVHLENALVRLLVLSPLLHHMNTHVHPPSSNRAYGPAAHDTNPHANPRRRWRTRWCSSWSAAPLWRATCWPT